MASIVQNGKGIWESTVSASQESWTNQINWIVRKKRKGGMTDAQIAKSMNVPVILVKKLWFLIREPYGHHHLSAQDGPGRFTHCQG